MAILLFVSAERRSEFHVDLAKGHKGVALRHLKLDQKLPRDHVTILLVVRKADAVRHPDPAIDVAVENGWPALFISHVNIFEPVQIIPTHDFHIFGKKGCQTVIIWNQINIVAVANMLADFLFTF